MKSRLLREFIKFFAFFALSFLFIFLLLSLWSPPLRNSICRLSKNKYYEFIFSLQKRSLKSELESGIFGRTAEDTLSYDELCYPYKLIAKGTPVMAIDLKGRPRSVNSERVLSVMLPNQYGDFIRGKIVLIPSQKLVWKQ